MAQAAVPAQLLAPDGRVQRKFNVLDHLTQAADKNYYNTLSVDFKLLIEVYVAAKVNTRNVGYGSWKRCVITSFVRYNNSLSRVNLLRIFEDAYLDATFTNVRHVFLLLWWCNTDISFVSFHFPPAEQFLHPRKFNQRH